VTTFGALSHSGPDLGVFRLRGQTVLHKFTASTVWKIIPGSGQCSSITVQFLKLCSERPIGLTWPIWVGLGVINRA